MSGHSNQTPPDNAEKPIIQAPLWVDRAEALMASATPVHPNIISGIKLFIITPLFIMTLKQSAILPGYRWLLLACFLAFGLLDYFDGILVRYRPLEKALSRFFDRATDYPLLLVISFLCWDFLPAALLVTKLLLDLILIIQFTLRLGNEETRIHTGINFTTLFLMLIVSQDWPAGVMTLEITEYLLWSNVIFSAVVALYNIGILQKRFIADALSGSNLLCGIFSMVFASRGQVGTSLFFLMLGAAFDGFDGAAARKFGGTRWGVYSDDVADAVNYGLAPGVALYFTIAGPQGIVIGICYSLFTIGRLVYFTLNKKNSDPDYFCGAPSPMGAMVAMSALILFRQYPVLVGFMVGVACIQMVSFDTNYRHLGRALASNRRIIYGMPFLIVLVIVGNLFVGRMLSVAVIFTFALIYGFIPTMTSFRRLFIRGTAG